MFDVWQAVAVFFISGMGGFIQRVTGFGFGIFVMLFFPYIMTAHTSAAAISTLVSCATSIYNAIKHRKIVPYKKNMALVIAALVTIPLAVRLSVYVSGDFFKKALGVVLVLLSVYFMFFNNRIKIKPSVKNGLIAGGVGGVLTGLFSTGGPPVVLYLMNAFSDNAVYFASTQFYFGLTGVYSTLVRFFNGIITMEVLLYSAIGFLGSIMGNFFGAMVFEKLDSEKLRQIVYFVMIVSGIIMIF